MAKTTACAAAAVRKRDASGKKEFLLFFCASALSGKFRGDRRLAAKKGETAKKVSLKFHAIFIVRRR